MPSCGTSSGRKFCHWRPCMYKRWMCIKRSALQRGAGYQMSTSKPKTTPSQHFCLELQSHAPDMPAEEAPVKETSYDREDVIAAKADVVQFLRGQSGHIQQGLQQQRTMPVSPPRCCDWKYTASFSLHLGHWVALLGSYSASASRFVSLPADKLTVGSLATSVVTPAVSVTFDPNSLRNVHDGSAASTWWHALHLKDSVLVAASSFG